MGCCPAREQVERTGGEKWRADARRPPFLQPESVYAFGATYFSELVRAREAEALARAEEEAAQRKLGDMEQVEIEEFVLELFKGADADGNGYLDRREFKAVMSSAELDLSAKDIRQIMAQCDENGDGVIEYREFLPLMTEILLALQAREAVAEERAANEDEAREAADEMLAFGVSQANLETTMRRAFADADADGNGVLSEGEFKQCLQDAALGLTKQQINVLMSETDLDGDGNVCYEEFVPICYGIFVEMFKEDILRKDVRNSADWLESTIIEHFTAQDENGVGKLPHKAVKKVLQRLSYEGFFIMGLSNLQIMAIMSEANLDSSNCVDYVLFARTAAGMIYNLLDTDAITKRQTALATMADSDAAFVLRGMSEDQIMKLLKQAFQEADADGNGYLTPDETFEVLHSLGAGDLGLTEKEVTALMASLDENDDGVVTYPEFITFMFDVLQHLDREAQITEIAFNSVLESVDAEAVGEAVAAEATGKAEVAALPDADAAEAAPEEALAAAPAEAEAEVTAAEETAAAEEPVVEAAAEESAAAAEVSPVKEDGPSTEATDAAAGDAAETPTEASAQEETSKDEGEAEAQATEAPGEGEVAAAEGNLTEEASPADEAAAAEAGEPEAEEAAPAEAAGDGEAAATAEGDAAEGDAAAEEGPGAAAESAEAPAEAEAGAEVEAPAEAEAEAPTEATAAEDVPASGTSEGGEAAEAASEAETAPASEAEPALEAEAAAEPAADAPDGGAAPAEDGESGEAAAETEPAAE